MMNKAIVLHSDILGFKKIIENAETDENNETLEKIRSAVEEGSKILEMFKDIEKPTKMKLSFKLFSDNLYASFSYTEGDLRSFSDAFIISIIFSRAYFANMLSNNIAVRGAISYGSDYNDDNIIFSIALVKAYTLEVEKAIFPRIIIDPKIIDLTREELEIPSPTIHNILQNSILRDQEGLYFVNPTGLAKDFASTITEVNAIDLNNFYILQNINFVMEELKKVKEDSFENNKIRKKYEWLLDLLIWLKEEKKNSAFLNSFTSLQFKRK